MPPPGSLSNKQRVDDILLRARRQPPMADPFADLAPVTPQSYQNQGRLQRTPVQEANLTRWDGVDPSEPVSGFRFEPPDAPGAPQGFDSDEAWNSGPGFRMGRTRPDWWPGELDAYAPEGPPAPEGDVWAAALRDNRVANDMGSEATNAPLDRVSLARLEGEAAEQEYSPLGEEWGVFDNLAGLANSTLRAGADSLMQPFSEDARERTADRRRYLSGAFEGALDWDPDGQTVGEMLADREGAESIGDWLVARPAQERASDRAQRNADADARSRGFDVGEDIIIEGERPDLGTRVRTGIADFWQAPSEMARDARREAVTGYALSDTARDAGDPIAAAAYERGANRSAATDAVITGSSALELAPGGLVDMGLGAGRFGSRQALRAIGGREAEIPWFLSPTEWANPGVLTREAASGRDRLLMGTAAVGGGATYADSLDGDLGDANQLTGGALATGGTLAALPPLLRGARGLIDPLADIAPAAGAREFGEGTRVYRPADRTEVFVEPDGRVVMKYEGGYVSGATDARAQGSAAEGMRTMRAALSALEQDIAETGRQSYHWRPGPDDAPADPRLAQVYRDAMQRRTPPGYLFSEDADGTMHLNRVVEAEGTPTVARRFEAAVRDPETGQVYTGADHREAIESAPDGVRERLEAIYDAPVEDTAYVGFNVDGQFMPREEGLQAMRSQRRPVRVGEQVNRDGSVTARDPIDWDDPNIRLPGDEAEFSGWAGAPTGPRRDPLRDIAPAVIAGGVGGYAAGELLNDEARADDGSESGDDPLLPILGAGAGAATIAAMRRGGFADEFAGTVGANGGRKPMRSWTQEEIDRAIEMRAGGAKMREIGEALDRQPGDVSRRLVAAGERSPDTLALLNQANATRTPGEPTQYAVQSYGRLLDEAERLATENGGSMPRGAYESLALATGYEPASLRVILHNLREGAAGADIAARARALKYVPAGIEPVNYAFLSEHLDGDLSNEVLAARLNAIRAEKGLEPTNPRAVSTAMSQLRTARRAAGNEPAVAEVATRAPGSGVDPAWRGSNQRARLVKGGKRRNDPLDAIAPLTAAGAGGAILFGDEAFAEDGDDSGNYLDALEAYGEETDYFGPGWRVVAPRGDIPSVRSLEFVRVEDDGQHAIMRDNASGRVFYARVQRDPGGGDYADAPGMSINVLGEMEPTGIGRSDFNPEAPRERTQAGMTPERPARLAASAFAGLAASARVRHPLAGPLVGGTVATGLDAALGGDDAEPVVAGSIAMIGRGAGQRFLDDVAIERAARAPEFISQRDAFARTLSDEAPKARASNPQAGLEFGAGGLELQVPRAELAEQGYARSLPATEASPRANFLSLEPREQIAWMESANARVGSVNDNLAAWEARRAADNAAPALPALSDSPSMVDQATAPTFPVGFYDPATGDPLFGSAGRRPPPRAERRPIDELRSPASRIGRTASDRVEAARELGVVAEGETVTGAEATRRIMDWGRLSEENMAQLRSRFPAIAAMLLGGSAVAGSVAREDPLAGVS